VTVGFRIIKILATLSEVGGHANVWARHPCGARYPRTRRRHTLLLRQSNPLDALPTAPSPAAPESPTGPAPTPSSTGEAVERPAPTPATPPSPTAPAHACAIETGPTPTPSTVPSPTSPADACAIERPPPTPATAPPPTGPSPAHPRAIETAPPSQTTPPSPTAPSPAPLYLLNSSGSLCSICEIVGGQGRCAATASDHGKAQDGCRCQDRLRTEHLRCSRWFPAQRNNACNNRWFPIGSVAEIYAPKISKSQQQSSSHCSDRHQHVAVRAWEPMCGDPCPSAPPNGFRSAATRTAPGPSGPRTPPM
jgi:hypothetical protein